MKRVDDKGFTLTELIVSIAIFAIVGVFLAGIFVPQINMFRYSEEKAHAKTVATTIVESISKKVNYGVDFSLSADDATLYFTEVTKTTADEVIIEGNTYGEIIYPNYTERILILFSLDENSTVTVKVTVLSEKKDGEPQKELYSEERKLKSLNSDIDKSKL